MLDPGGSLKTVIALWRSPERLSTSARWPADAPHLVDAVAFGEALLASVRPASGHAAPWPIGDIVVAEKGYDLVLGKVAQTPAATLGLGGALAASPLRSYDQETAETPDIVDTGYACAMTPNEQTLVVTASPAGLVNVGGYRFALQDLQSRIGQIDSDGVLAALPHALTGHRLAGHAANSEVVRAKLEESGLNPLISCAFHDPILFER
jgi:hypothetical protein